MYLKSLTLTNFRRFREVQVALDRPVTCLVGTNNSGKTTILEAICLVLNLGSERGGTHLHRGTDSGPCSVSLTFQMNHDEWKRLAKARNSRKEISDEAFFDMLAQTDVTAEWAQTWSEGRVVSGPNRSFKLANIEQFPDQNRSLAQNLASSVGSYSLTDLFGIVYLPTTERPLSAAENFVPYQNIQLFQQRHSYICNVLYHLKRKKPGAFEDYANNVRSFFPEITEVDVEFDQDTGKVGLRVKEAESDVTLTESGSGTRSFVSLFAHLLWPDVSLAIIDEPDIHLHSGLISQLVGFLRRLSTRIQFIVTSHNEAFINRIELEEMQNIYSTGVLTSSVSRVTDPGVILRQLAEIGITLPKTEQVALQQFSQTLSAQDSEIVSTKIESVAQQAKQRLDSLSLSYHSPSELQLADQHYHIEPQSRAGKLLEKLESCPQGKEHWSDYEDICKEILTYCLVPSLMEPLMQNRTENGFERRDLILHIPHEAPPSVWSWLHTDQRFGSLAVIVDCKNYSSELSGDEVYKTTKYLSKDRLGMFGIIVTRIGFAESGQARQNEVWRSDSKLVVCLNDADLKQMLEMKEAGAQPSFIIDKKIREFFQRIGPST
ncbi:MAG: ATP-binding protein [Dehalococcoidia bacterium]|nr:ATP-binding protein [Dehalococcoidia bacterium]